MHKWIGCKSEGRHACNHQSSLWCCCVSECYTLGAIWFFLALRLQCERPPFPLLKHTQCTSRELASAAAGAAAGGPARRLVQWMQNLVSNCHTSHICRQAGSLKALHASPHHRDFGLVHAAGRRTGQRQPVRSRLWVCIRWGLQCGQTARPAALVSAGAPAGRPACCTPFAQSTGRISGAPPPLPHHALTAATAACRRCLQEQRGGQRWA